MKAVVIDLFGTLIEVESDELAHKALSKELAEIHGNVFSWEELMSKYESLVKESNMESGDAVWRSLNELLSERGLKPRLTYEEVLKLHALLHGKYAVPVKGMREALINARKLFDKVALLTDGDGEVVNSIIKELGIRDFFDVVVTKSDVHASKPDPKLFKECLKRLGVKTSSAIMIGDRCSDVEGAKAVGMKVITVKEVINCRAEPDAVTDNILNAVKQAFNLLKTG